MRRKHMLSLSMLITGVALLVAATTVGAASSATQHSSKIGANKGGTLRLNMNSADFDFVDPQLAYRTDDWGMIFTTAMQLVSFPEKSGAAGSQLYPQAATSFPTVSKDGKTYTFHIRSGLAVLGRLAGDGGSLPAVVGADPEPEDGLAAGRQPVAAG